MASTKIKSRWDSDEEELNDNDKCSICLCKITDRASSKSCFHEFCFNCLKEWSKVKRCCPLCKKPFSQIQHNFRGAKADTVHCDTFVREPSTRPQSSSSSTAPFSYAQLFSSNPYISDIQVGVSLSVRPQSPSRRPPAPIPWLPNFHHDVNAARTSSSSNSNNNPFPIDPRDIPLPIDPSDVTSSSRLPPAFPSASQTPPPAPPSARAASGESGAARSEERGEDSDVVVVYESRKRRKLGRTIILSSDEDEGGEGEVTNTRREKRTKRRRHRRHEQGYEADDDSSLESASNGPVVSYVSSRRIRDFDSMANDEQDW